MPLRKNEITDRRKIQNFLKITNFRINFTRFHTINERGISTGINDLYYGISQLKVFGSCFCNGHASECYKVDGLEYDIEKNLEIGYSVCKCQHNTQGTNCQECTPLYNDRPWSPARNGCANECHKCECNGHAYECRFDEELFIRTNGRTGGICVCMHNTEGNNCERCKKNYYRDLSLPFTHQDSCKGLHNLLLERVHFFI